jgi:phosphopantetheine adenylyltransferase
MKTFFQFFTESQAVQQATRMGLKSDGHGGWYDKKGEFVAKTEKGQLKFFNKRQRVGKQDPPQSEKEKKLSQTTTDKEKPIEMIPPEVEKTKGTLTIAFGRFNPPTTGHQKLLDTVATSSDDGDYIIVPSRSQDKKKNPLDADSKVEVMKQMFPNHSGKIINDPANKTIFDVMKKAHTDGYANIRIVGGSDRVGEFEKLTGTYNKKLYDFDKIEVRSAGDRDADGEGVEGMSASKQRKYAADNDFKGFLQGVPTSMNREMAKQLFQNVRSGMKIEEGWNLWQIAPKFDWKNLRENYINKKIFNIGEIVENVNTGLIGKIIRRGTSYLICVTEDKIMFKSWIKDVSEAVVNGTEISGVPADQRLVGTDAHRKYVETMVPGSSYGKHFINKYRKKKIDTKNG